MNSLKDIDKSKELQEFVGEDKRIALQIDEIKSKYYQIIEIYQNIGDAPPNKKIEAIDEARPKMNLIEIAVKKKD